MNGICSKLNRFYGAVPADDCNSSWLAVKVDRAGNMIILEDGFETEYEAELSAGIHHQTDLIDLEVAARDKTASIMVEGVAVSLVFANIFVWAAIYHTGGVPQWMLP